MQHEHISCWIIYIQPLDQFKAFRLHLLAMYSSCSFLNGARCIYFPLLLHIRMYMMNVATTYPLVKQTISSAQKNCWSPSKHCRALLIYFLHDIRFQTWCLSNLRTFHQRAGTKLWWLLFHASSLEDLVFSGGMSITMEVVSSRNPFTVTDSCITKPWLISFIINM